MHSGRLDLGRQVRSVKGGGSATARAAAALACALLSASCATAGGYSSSAVPQTTSSGPRPQPPDNLDALLIEHYPLRGHVLEESGEARARFTVAASGAVTVNAILSASHPAYGDACAHMLRQSTWRPASRDGNAVAYTGDFVCRFEHQAAERRRATSSIAAPAVQRAYGDDWWPRDTAGWVARDAVASLRLRISANGRPKVVAVEAESDPRVASACGEMIEAGPAWRPAKSAEGDSVAQTVTFRCAVEVESRNKMLWIGAVGVIGRRPTDELATALADSLLPLSFCYESAVGLGKDVQGRSRVAFEILPSGTLGRVEWVQTAHSDPVLDGCVFRALRSLRFTPNASKTIVDVELHVGGVSPAACSACVPPTR